MLLILVAQLVFLLAWGGLLLQLWAQLSSAQLSLSLATLLCGLFCFYRLWKVRREVSALKIVADRIASGEMQLNIPLPSDSELRLLATSLDSMARQLAQRIKEITQQGSDQQAVFSSMREGVVALDLEGRVLRLNQAAQDLLGLSGEEWVGRALEEVVRNSRLQRFISSVLKSKTPLEGDVLLYDRGERFVQAYGTQLLSSEGGRLGALIVLNDITKLKQLENVRRDFVANVSHELRTPITSIKGFVETLRDGALENPKDAKRFLEIISRQADRLSAIFDDLLRLARIEIERDQEQIEFAACDLMQIAKQAIESKTEQARIKQVRLELEGGKGFLYADVNASLIEQALVNLIDNAIRHSDQGQIVTIKLSQSQNETLLSVSDQGCGIHPKHLARLFERFYRVDKARSRDSGGTGLGLAIVKHIAQAHGGFPEVVSVLDQGSLFSIRLPRTANLEAQVA